MNAFEPRTEELCASSRTVRFCSTWWNTTATTFTDPVRLSLAAQWVLFANATLATALFVPSNREREFPGLMHTLDALLVPIRPWLGSTGERPAAPCSPIWPTCRSSSPISI